MEQNSIMEMKHIVRAFPVEGAELAHAVGHTGVLAAVGVTDPNLVRAVRAALPAQPVNKPPDSTAG